MASFLDVVIGGRAVETPPMSSVNLLEGLSRTVVYMTYSQLTTLVSAEESKAVTFRCFICFLPFSFFLGGGSLVLSKLGHYLGDVA